MNERGKPNLRLHRGKTHAHDGFGGTVCGVRAIRMACEVRSLPEAYPAGRGCSTVWYWTTLPVDCAKCKTTREATA